MQETFTKREVQKKIKNLEGWTLRTKGTEISRLFIFKDFKEALRFTNKIGKLAEEAKHHPSVVLSYGKVKVTLSTHSAGGLTQKDFDLADQISRQMVK